MEVRRGEVYWVDFGDVRGKEIAHQHPAVVVSITTLNRFLLVMVPGTSGSNVTRDYPTNVRVAGGTAGLDHETVFKCQQIRAVDPDRLQAFIGSCSDQVMRQIEDAIRDTLGLVG